MVGRKRCPKCAESIRKEAQVCRYCGYAFPQSPLVAIEGSKLPARVLVGAAVLLVLLAAAFVGYFVPRQTDGPIPNSERERRITATQPSLQLVRPAYEPLPVGATLEWTADGSPDKVIRQAGPYILTIIKQADDGLVAPLIQVVYGNDLVRLKGEALSPTYSHRVSAIQNVIGGPPVVMLQSFTGGAHCCNHVQLAGLSSGKLKIVEFGTWDGDQIELPKDLSGDGIADFVVSDDRFLYTFSPYAMSYSPPKVMNVVGGKVRDVSRSAAFRRIYASAMNEAGAVCRSAEDGLTRNGACPAYVAAAARAGKLNAAWSEMIGAYDASTDWELPTGCVVSTQQECPKGREIQFKSYPEALLHFLKETGYIEGNWQPPEFYQAPDSTGREESPAETMI